MIDHFNLPVADLERSASFYVLALGALGYRLVARDGAALGFGRDSWRFGIVEAPPPIPKLHLAFEARSRDEVRRCFDAAVAAGGRANGAPGLRPNYDADYFAAFVLDPDGHNIEAVCRKP